MEKKEMNKTEGLLNLGLEIDVRDESLIEEMTPTEIETMKRVKRGKRAYNGELKRAMSDILASEIVTADNQAITVADKIAMKAIEDAIRKPSVDKYVSLMKITGEYSEKTEVKVDNLGKIMETLKGEEY